MSNFSQHRNTIALTGASGFIGRSLIREFKIHFDDICTIGRTPLSECCNNIFLDFSANDWRVVQNLSKVRVLVHSAARAHVVGEESKNPLDEYLHFNTKSTLKLAEQAASVGVTRFVYISSVKAVGESTTGQEPFSNTSPLMPTDSYGYSKALAEEGLKEIAERTGMEVTIIRPPLVYGVGVKANFQSMMRLAKLNLPLPLASISNKRSLVALQNLVDLIVKCTTHSLASNQTFMVSDGEDVSTPQLLAAMTRAYGKEPRLLPCPPIVLSSLINFIGKRDVNDRLLGSLQVDIKHTKKTLCWKPFVKLEDVLGEIAYDSIP